MSFSSSNIVTPLLVSPNSKEVVADTNAPNSIIKAITPQSGQVKPTRPTQKNSNDQETSPRTQKIEGVISSPSTSRRATMILNDKEDGPDDVEGLIEDIHVECLEGNGEVQETNPDSQLLVSTTEFNTTKRNPTTSSPTRNRTRNPTSPTRLSSGFASFSSGVKVRGVCSICKNVVLTDQARYRDEAGNYTHEICGDSIDPKKISSPRDLEDLSSKQLQFGIRSSMLKDLTNFDYGSTTSTTAAAKTSTARLVLIGEDGENPPVGMPPYFTLTKERTTIGRSLSADLTINSKSYPDTISGTHIVIWRQELGNGKLQWHVSDSDSRNGTFIDCVKVEDSEINDGAILTLGGGAGLKKGEKSDLLASDLVFRFELVDVDETRALPLSQAAIEIDWDKVMESLFEEPDGIMLKNEGGDTLLHMCFKSKTASQEIALKLVSLYPAGTKVQDTDGRLPLHLATIGGSPAVFCQKKHLLVLLSEHVSGHRCDICRKSLSRHDTMYRCPEPGCDYDMCAECYRQASPTEGGISQDFDLVSALVASFGEGLKIKDKKGRLPLHHAIANNASLQVVQVLLESYPESVQEKDIAGNTPFSLSLNHEYKNPKEILLALISAYPNCAKELIPLPSQSAKMTPLLIAIICQQPFEVLEALLAVYPEAGKIKCASLHPLHVIFSKYKMKAIPTLRIKSTTWVLDAPGLSHQQQWAIRRGPSKSTETLSLVYNGSKVQGVGVKDGWLELADGGGFSLAKSPDHGGWREEKINPESLKSCTRKRTTLDLTPDQAASIIQGMWRIRIVGIRCIKKMAVAKLSLKRFVSALISADPEGLKEKNKDGNFPLHCAIANKSSDAELIEILLTAYPEAAQEKDENSKLPIHLAVENKLSFEVVNKLLLIYPDGRMVKTKNGKIPLHYVVNDTNVTEALLASFEETAQIKDIDGKLPLHRAATDGKVSLGVISMLIASFPGSAKVKDLDGRLPLHYAVREQISIEIVQIILNAYPEAVKEKDGKHDQLPLSYAIEYKAPLAVSLALLKIDPSATQEMDSYGKLPLEYALSTMAPIKLVEELLLIFPNAAKKRNKKRNNMLHVAMSSDFETIKEGDRVCLVVKTSESKVGSVGVITDGPDDDGDYKIKFDGTEKKSGYINKKKIILEDRVLLADRLENKRKILIVLANAYPEGIGQTNADGDTPFNKAFESTSMPSDVILAFISLYPLGATIPDKDGLIPLHHAVNSKTISLEVLLALISSYEEGLKFKDNDGRLPLHHATKNNAPMKVVEALLKGYPEAIQEKDEKYYQIPLTYAIEYDATHALTMMLLSKFPAGAQMKEKNGYLPIHCALRLEKPNFELIEALILANPDGIKETTHGTKKTPLHYAIALFKNLNKLKVGDKVRLTKEEVQSAIGTKKIGTVGKIIFGPDSDGDCKLLFEEDGSKSSYIKSSSFELVTPYLSDEVEKCCKLVLKLLSLYPDGMAQKTSEGHSPFSLVFSTKNVPTKIILAFISQDQKTDSHLCAEKDGNDKLPLHYAISNNMSIEVLTALLDAYPKGVEAKDSNGATVFNLAVASKLPIEVMLVLINAHPKGMEVKDENGYLPLHHALRSPKPNFEQIDALLLAYPDGIKETTRLTKKTPLHYAVALFGNIVTVKVGDKVRLTKEEVQSAIGTKKIGTVGKIMFGPDSDGDFKLLFEDGSKSSYMKSSSFELVIPYLSDEVEKCCKLVLKLLSLYPDGMAQKNSEGHSPFNLVFSTKNVPTKIILAFISQDQKTDSPLLCAEKDGDGKLLLHHAINKNLPLEVLTALLDAYPKGVEAKDSNGATALNVAFKTSRSTEVMLALIIAYPDGANIKDKDGFLPLHHAIERKLPMPVLESLLKVYSEVEKSEYVQSIQRFFCVGFDNTGVAYRNTKNMKDRCKKPFSGQQIDIVRPHTVIEGKLTAGENWIEVDVPDGVGLKYIPMIKEGNVLMKEQHLSILHCAVANKSPLEVVKKLLAASPIGAKSTDSFGRTPLAFAISNTASPDIILALLAAHSEGAKIQNKDGDFPLHKAMTTLVYYGDKREEDSAHEVILALILAYPEVAQKMDKEGHLPLNLCIDVLAQKTEPTANNVELCQLLYKHTPPSSRDDVGRNRDDLVKQACNVNVREWALTLGTKYNRYKLEHPIRPIYESATCEVYFATCIDTIDTNNDTNQGETKGVQFFNPLSSRRVAMKFLRAECHYIAEQNARSIIKGTEPQHILSVEAYHTIRKEDAIPANTCGAPSWEGVLDEFCIIMPAADRSLMECIHAENIASNKFAIVQHIARNVADGLKELHALNIIHCDIKPRNVVRIGSDWKIIDLDAALSDGDSLSKDQKHSSGGVPPEMARVLFTNNEKTKETNETDETKDGTNATAIDLVASTSFDVWSFGILLYQLCTGVSLFHLDLNSDDLRYDEDRERLMQWKEGPPEKELIDIFRKSINITNSQREDARDLIRACLQGDPKKRYISMNDILTHKFLQSDRNQGNRWHQEKKGFFLSHFQTNAGPSAMKLRKVLKDVVNVASNQKRLTHAVHVWLDKDETPTVEGMKAGIASHECFVLILSDGVFSRWFCQLEIKEALRLGKKLLLVDLRDVSIQLGQFWSKKGKVDSADKIVKEDIQRPLQIGLNNFSEYINQCALHFNEKEVSQIFAATSVPFCNDDDFDQVTATELLQQANYFLPTKTSKVQTISISIPNEANENEKKEQETKDIFVLGADTGYFSNFCDSLKTVQSSARCSIKTAQSSLISMPCTTDGNDLQQKDIFDNCKYVIFYASTFSFQNDVTMHLLKLYDSTVHKLVVVRETDSRQGSMSETLIRETAHKMLNEDVFQKIFGVEEKGWIPMIPFFTDKSFRDVAVLKTRRRLFE